MSAPAPDRYFATIGGQDIVVVHGMTLRIDLGVDLAELGIPAGQHVHIGEVRVVYTRCDGAACTCCLQTEDTGR